MKNLNKNSNYKVMFVVFILLFVGWIGYNCNENNKPRNKQKSREAITNQKNDLLIDLANLNNYYIDEIVTNPVVNQKINIKRNKVLKLIDEVIATNTKSVEEYEEKIKRLKYETKILASELVDESSVSSKKNNLNKLLTIENDSNITAPVLVLYKEKSKLISEKINKTIEHINVFQKKNETKIEAETDLTHIKNLVENLKVNTIKINKNGEQIFTQIAKETDALRINFNIPENQQVKVGNRTYFVQIFDENDIMVFQKGKTIVNGKVLEYSLKSEIEYKNKNIRFTENILGNAYKKGTYKIKIFDQNDLVSETSFTLI